MAQVLDQVRRAIECSRLVSSGESIVVGVSGGPDSLCLLHVLCRLTGEYGLALHVVHLHHGLRGADADADAGAGTDTDTGTGTDIDTDTG